MSSFSTVRQYKSFPFQVKAVDDDQGLIEAYGSVFDNVDMGDDIVKPGAFKRTIQNSKSRVQAGKAKFLAMMLWNHDSACPIGGWGELKEDSHGLLCKGQIILTTQAGREAYELIKAGVIQEFSIGYEVVPGGASYDGKTGYRNLTELRLWEVSPVTFAMNQEALLVGVKSMQTKSVCGDTSLSIGPRDEAWDGSKAKKQIFAYAANSDGTINASKAKKCFLQLDGDSTLKGSYHYPFCYVEDGSPRISVGGVKACAGALAGGRGASTEGGDVDGMRRKVATMYTRINKQYPDDPELSPSWEKSMNRRELKTLLEHYNEEQAENLCEDWQDVFVCSLTCAILDAFTIGDSPASDVSEALDAFKELVMSKFVPQAIECNLSGYLEEHTSTYSYNSAENMLHSGSSDGYGYMSRVAARMQRKAGKPISAANQSHIDDHVAAVHDLANQASKSMKASMKALHDAADSFASRMAGNDDDSQDEKNYYDALRELKALRA